MIAQGSLTPDHAYAIAYEIAEGLDAIHGVGIVHRDLKTANIMLDAAGTVRLMDFGIAKNVDDAGTTGATATGHVMGTPAYMSPEQARGEKVDFRSDIYALGVVIYELFTSRTPFEGDTPVAVIMKHIHDPPPLEGERGRRSAPGARPRAAARARQAPRGSAAERRGAGARARRRVGRNRLVAGIRQAGASAGQDRQVERSAAPRTDPRPPRPRSRPSSRPLPHCMLPAGLAKPQPTVLLQEGRRRGSPATRGAASRWRGRGSCWRSSRCSTSGASRPPNRRPRPPRDHTDAAGRTRQADSSA